MSEELDQGQATTTESVGGESVTTQQPELTIQDLSNLRSIIDVASQRGAFRAAEFSAVGSSFNKLNDFLNAVAPPEVSNEETEPSA